MRDPLYLRKFNFSKMRNADFTWFKAHHLPLSIFLQKKPHFVILFFFENITSVFSHFAVIFIERKKTLGIIRHCIYHSLFMPNQI